MVSKAISHSNLQHYPPVNKLTRKYEFKALLTLDIVGYANLTTNEDIEIAIEMLHRLLEISVAETEDFIWNSSGDGGSLTFDDINHAQETARELSKNLKIINQKSDLQLELRLAIHRGHVFQGRDFNGSVNVWGVGINQAFRILDVAKPNQILATGDYVKETRKTGKLPSEEVETYGTWSIKHSEPLDLYNLRLGDAGIAVDDNFWIAPFVYPLNQAIQMYEQMLQSKSSTRQSELTVQKMAICKRLLDFNPEHESALNTLQAITQPGKSSSTLDLYHPDFSELTFEALLHLLTNATFKRYSKDETLFTQASDADYVTLLVSGEVRVTIDKTNMSEIRAGDMIGEMGFFDDPAKRRATVVALTDTLALNIDYETFKTDLSTTTIQDELYKLLGNIYKKRITQNILHSHEIFQPLTDAERHSLGQRAAFYRPESRTLPAETAWDSILILVHDELKAHVRINQPPSRPLRWPMTYTEGECLGLVHMSNKFETCPFEQIEVETVDTAYIAIPWNTIEFYFEKNEAFKKACWQYFKININPKWHHFID